MKIVLFLGAGASVQFGNPTTKEFKKFLIDSGDVDYRVKPILNLKSFPDIEYVLQCLKEVLDSRDTILGKFLLNDEFDVLIRQEPEVTFNHIMGMGAGGYNQIMQFLFQKYKIEEDVKPKLNDFFKPLFDLISNYSEHIVVGTTNYDLAIETYCNLTGSDYQCVDGFHMSESRYEWNPNYLNENFDRSGERFVYLHKIHGSLNWIGKNPDLIKFDQIPNFEPENSAKPSTIIAPTLSPKDAYSKPPFQFLLKNYSKHLLESDVCMVIGFSFRDSHITEYFKEFIDDGKHLIIISPSCYRDYAENIFKLQNDFSDEAIKEWSTSHARGAVNRHVSFIDLPFDGENNNKIFEKIKNMLK